VPQFDVYRAPEEFGDIAFFLDIQSDLLLVAETRVLVPLMAKSVAPRAVGRLNPLITLRGKQYLAQFQDIQSYSVADFGKPIDNLAKQRFDFVIAFDLLISGI
jgi:toxin CcdB